MLEGFAHVVVAEAADGGQAPGVHRRGAVVQGVPDGLTQQRQVLAGKRHLALLVGGQGVSVCPQPIEREDALLSSGKLEAEDGGLLAEGMFGGEQEALLLVVLGVRQDEQAAGHGSQQLERARFLSDSGLTCSDGAHEQDGAAGALSELGESGKHRSRAREKGRSSMVTLSLSTCSTVVSRSTRAGSPPAARKRGLIV